MIGIADMVAFKLLVTRTTARNVGAGIAEALNESAESLALDFAGIQGFTPSFFDELLHSMGELSQSHGRDLLLELANPPAELSSVHEAIARAHGLRITEADGGSWLIGPP